MSDPGTIYCGHCGEVTASLTFCAHCGGTLGGAEVAAAEVAVPASYSASDAIRAGWINQAKADGTYDAAATISHTGGSSRARAIGRQVTGYALMAGFLALIVGGLTVGGAVFETPKDPDDYSPCQSFAGSPGVIPEAECVENGEVIRWKDSRHYFTYP